MVCEKIQFCHLESGRSKPWCPGLVSRSSAKAQEPLARSRGQWQEVEGLLFSPENSQLVHILSFHSQAVVSLFIFPTHPTALNSEPCGRRYVKNTGHDRNRLYSRAIHCPTSMEKHYVQWFLLKSVQDITVCEKKIRFCLLESGRTKARCPGLVSRQSAKAQEPVARSRGLVIQPSKLLVGAYFELSSQGVISLFIFPTGSTALDSEPRGRRYVKNTGHNRNHLYPRAIHCPASMEKHYVQWFLLKSVQDIMVCEKNQILPS